MRGQRITAPYEPAHGPPRLAQTSRATPETKRRDVHTPRASKSSVASVSPRTASAHFFEDNGFEMGQRCLRRGVHLTSHGAQRLRVRLGCQVPQHRGDLVVALRRLAGAWRSAGNTGVRFPGMLFAHDRLIEAPRQPRVEDDGFAHAEHVALFPRQGWCPLTPYRWGG